VFLMSDNIDFLPALELLKEYGKQLILIGGEEMERELAEMGDVFLEINGNAIEQIERIPEELYAIGLYPLKGDHEYLDLEKDGLYAIVNVCDDDWYEGYSVMDPDQVVKFIASNYVEIWSDENVNELMDSGSCVFDEEMKGEGEVELSGQNIDHLRRLLIEESGLIFDSSIVQIGCKVKQSSDPILKMILFYKNKSDKKMENVQLIGKVDEIEMTSQPSGAFNIGAGENFQQRLRWKVNYAFSAIPEFIVSFTLDGQAIKLPLKLPLSVTRFSSPLELSTKAFKEESGNYKLSLQFDIDSEVARTTSVDRIKEKIFSGLQMSLVDGLTKNTNEVFSASQFHYMNANANVPETIVMLSRFVKTDAGLRVTIKSSSAVVNEGVEKVLRVLFKAL